jgi:hypothetical protein
MGYTIAGVNGKCYMLLYLGTLFTTIRVAKPTLHLQLTLLSSLTEFFKDEESGPIFRSGNCMQMLLRIMVRISIPERYIIFKKYVTGCLNYKRLNNYRQY